jgi:hypothetical protein
VPKGGKGDVEGQKARWRERVRERRAADPAFAEQWRAQRRDQKQRARERKRQQKQWLFDDGAPNRCRTCGGAVPDQALYCARIPCNPHLRRRARRRK